MPLGLDSETNFPSKPKKWPHFARSLWPNFCGTVGMLELVVLLHSPEGLDWKYYRYRYRCRRFIRQREVFSKRWGEDNDNGDFFVKTRSSGDEIQDKITCHIVTCLIVFHLMKLWKVVFFFWTFIVRTVSKVRRREQWRQGSDMNCLFFG